MSAGAQTTFLFLQKKKKNSLEPGVGAEQTRFSEGGGRANKGLPSKMVETQGDFSPQYFGSGRSLKIFGFSLNRWSCACCSFCCSEAAQPSMAPAAWVSGGEAPGTAPFYIFKFISNNYFSSGKVTISLLLFPTYYQPSLQVFPINTCPSVTAEKTRKDG